MQLLHASGVPCVPTCDKPCFKPTTTDIQRIQLPLVHPPTAPLRDAAPRTRSHPGISPGRQTLANWSSLGTVTHLSVEQDKHERVFARVVPHDREEKETWGLAAEGKGPRQGTRDAVSVDRQKTRTQDPSL